MSDWLRQLQTAIPAERVSTRASDLEAASRDESTLPPQRPAAVAWPLHTGEVEAAVRAARHHGVAVTARGAGSSLEGNSIPQEGGLVLDLTRMDRVLAVEPADMLVRVQPGVVYARLNRELEPTGLFFPPHPGGSAEVATVGGMTATNASGIYSVRYGGTRDYVRAATVVTGTGAVLRLGSACRKISSGYHLIGLIVGAEGTLGIATEITLALAPLPVARRRFALRFPREEDAGAAIAAMMRFGVPLAAVEFLDRRCVAAVNRYRRSSVPEEPLILLEAHGSTRDLDDQEQAATDLAVEHRGTRLEAGTGGDPWSLREHVTRAIQSLQPEAQMLRTDLAFPVSRLAAIVCRSHQRAAQLGVTLHTFGHAGLGILHALILARRTEARAWECAATLKDDLVELVLDAGGSVSGEHGLGLGNRKYARREHGDAIDVMRAVKAVFDPDGILNPGKIWEA